MSTDYANDLILLTCASGNQCSHILPLLHGKFQRLRLAVHAASSATRLKSLYPNAEVVQADLTNPSEAARIMSGVTTCLHIGPSVHACETEIGYNMIDAAVAETRHPESGFKHFIYSSVLNTQLRKLLNHECKRYVEERLIESALRYTILQPSGFMDWPGAVQTLSAPQPVYTCLVNPDTPETYIALRDLGEAAARVIEEREKHYFAQYPLTSTEPMSRREFVRVVSEETGKEIKIDWKPLVEAVEIGLQALCGSAEEAHPRSRDVVERLFLWTNRRGLIGNSNMLEWLLGRKPTSVREWAALWVQAGKQE